MLVSRIVFRKTALNPKSSLRPPIHQLVSRNPFKTNCVYPSLYPESHIALPVSIFVSRIEKVINDLEQLKEQVISQRGDDRDPGSTPPNPALPPPPAAPAPEPTSIMPATVEDPVQPLSPRYSVYLM